MLRKSLKSLISSTLSALSDVVLFHTLTMFLTLRPQPTEIQYTSGQIG